MQTPHISRDKNQTKWWARRNAAQLNLKIWLIRNRLCLLLGNNRGISDPTNISNAQDTAIWIGQCWLRLLHFSGRVVQRIACSQQTIKAYILLIWMIFSKRERLVLDRTATVLSPNFGHHYAEVRLVNKSKKRNTKISLSILSRPLSNVEANEHNRRSLWHKWTSE